MVMHKGSSAGQGLYVKCSNACKTHSVPSPVASESMYIISCSQISMNKSLAVPGIIF